MKNTSITIDQTNIKIFPGSVSNLYNRSSRKRYGTLGPLDIYRKELDINCTEKETLSITVQKLRTTSKNVQIPITVLTTLDSLKIEINEKIINIAAVANANNKNIPSFAKKVCGPSNNRPRPIEVNNHQNPSFTKKYPVIPPWGCHGTVLADNPIDKPKLDIKTC